MKLPNAIAAATYPGSIATPAFLQRIQWVNNPAEYMTNAVQDYPDIFISKILSGKPVIFVNQPQAIQEVLTNDRKKYTAPGEYNKILTPITGNYSVVSLDGETHRKRRQLVMPSFHGDRMKAYGELIIKLTKQVMDELPINQPFLARSAMQEISMQVILQSVFGLYEGDRCEKLRYLMGKMSDIFRSPFASSFLFFPFLQKDLGKWTPWGKFLRDREQIDKLIYAEISERRQNSNADRIDILSLLISAKDEDGEALTDQELRDELMVLLFAGHETTATAMAWGLYWSHYLPEIGKKVQQEIDSLGNYSDVMDIFKLPYLTAFCNETLRINPVAMITFPRLTQGKVELLGYEIPPDTVVFGCIYLVHQREDLYPQPRQFKPERFLKRQFSPYEFMPFGGGVRRCVGEALAMFEMKLVLGTILAKYQLALVDSQPEIPRRRGVTLAPSKGVKMVLTGIR
jgi:cytochrome P450 family 110